MKIVIYVENYIAGGVDTVLANKINAWPLTDEIILICNKSHDGLEKILRKRITRPYRLVLSNILSHTEIINKYSKFLQSALLKPFFYYAKYLLGVYNCIRVYLKLNNQSIDAIFIHNGGYPAADSCRFIVLSAKFASIKNVYMVVHNFATPYQLFNWPFEYVLDKITEKYCKMICVSQKCHDYLVNLRNMKNEKFIIYNGVNPLEKKAPNNIDPNLASLKEKYLFIAIIAWFDETKGHQDLFQALSIIKNELSFQNVKLLVFGKGATIESEARISELIRHYQIEDNVLLMGFKPNIMEYMHYIDVLVAPSRQYEGFSMTALEAIFCNIPTVISSVCGISEILVDKKSTFIIQPYNPQELALALHNLLTNKLLRETISNEAKKQICHLFDAKKMVLEYSKLLNFDNKSTAMIAN